MGDKPSTSTPVSSSVAPRPIEVGENLDSAWDDVSELDTMRPSPPSQPTVSASDSSAGGGVGEPKRVGRSQRPSAPSAAPKARASADDFEAQLRDTTPSAVGRSSRDSASPASGRPSSGPPRPAPSRAPRGSGTRDSAPSLPPRPTPAPRGAPLAGGAPEGPVTSATTSHLFTVGGNKTLPLDLRAPMVEAPGVDDDQDARVTLPAPASAAGDDDETSIRAPAFEGRDAEAPSATQAEPRHAVSAPAASSGPSASVGEEPGADYEDETRIFSASGHDSSPPPGGATGDAAGAAGSEWDEATALRAEEAPPVGETAPGISFNAEDESAAAEPTATSPEEPTAAGPAPDANPLAVSSTEPGERASGTPNDVSLLPTQRDRGVDDVEFRPRARFKGLLLAAGALAVLGVGAAWGLSALEYRAEPAQPSLAASPIESPATTPSNDTSRALADTTPPVAMEPPAVQGEREVGNGDAPGKVAGEGQLSSAFAAALQGAQGSPTGEGAEAEGAEAEGAEAERAEAEPAEPAEAEPAEPAEAEAQAEPAESEPAEVESAATDAEGQGQPPLPAKVTVVIHTLPDDALIYNPLGERVGKGSAEVVVLPRAKYTYTALRHGYKASKILVDGSKTTLDVEMVRAWPKN